MSHWNYRLFNHKDGYFAIVECYYDEQNKPRFYTESVRPYGETLEELKKDFEWMQKALSKPVLTENDFPEQNEDPFANLDLPNVDEEEGEPW